MAVFAATLNQTAFLFLFIVAGYILAKTKLVPDNSQGVLSKLEQYIFIPALVLGTFISGFSPENLTKYGKLLLGSSALAVLAIGLTLVCVRFCSKDKYERNIFTYGLSFPNFGYMGNAVVSALFPAMFSDYLIFVLPLWTLIYLWGVPSLLIGGSGKPTVRERLKNFLNPMFVCMVLGIAIGLLGISMPKFIDTAVSAAGSCMSPVGMLLTGMTVARFKLKDVLNIKSVYVVTALRLLVFPGLFLGAMALFPMEKTFATCAICALAMPLGLNTIIIPNALGKDTRVASSMALVSHILACITIPVILAIFQNL